MRLAGEADAGAQAPLMKDRHADTLLSSCRSISGVVLEHPHAIGRRPPALQCLP